MATNDDNVKPGPLQYIFLGFMLLITFYLTFLYIKSKEFHTYSCYNIIVMSITIFIGGLINILIPNDLGRESSQFFWGFLKDFFNKLIMSILTMQVIVLYFGIMKTEFYYSREKLIFIIGTIICAGVSVGIAIIFNGLKVVDDVYHEYLDDYEDVKDPDLGEELKKRLYSIVSIEMIFSGVIFVINVFCLIVVMNFISKKHKEAKEGLIEDLGYKNQLIRFIFMFFLNIIAIVSSSVFLVFDVFDKKANESIYLATCFIIDLCHSINKTVYVETLKIFCKSKAEKLNGETGLKKQNTFDQNDEGTVDDD
jgi:hypothetical protein